MKTFFLLAAAGLLTILVASPLRAQSTDAATNSSSVKALLDDLLKQMNGAPSERSAPAPQTEKQTQATPAPSQQITPETFTQLQKLLNQLLKDTKAAETEENAPDRSPTPPAAAPAVAGQKSASPLSVTGLTTSTLKPAHLMPSGPLDGHGTKGGTPRLSDDDWHQLFRSK
jgi:hypothetical protein